MLTTQDVAGVSTLVFLRVSSSFALVGPPMATNALCGRRIVFLHHKFSAWHVRDFPRVASNCYATVLTTFLSSPLLVFRLSRMLLAAGGRILHAGPFLSL